MASLTVVTVLTKKQTKIDSFCFTYSACFFLKFIYSWHMERMNDGRLAKRVMESEVEGRRARGRPRMGWSEGVKNSLDAIGVPVEDRRVLANDRGEWKKIVKMVKSR